VALTRGHPLARGAAVALQDLEEQTFAVVGERDGPGYNAAVRTMCRRVGFEPRVAGERHGPVAWETPGGGATAPDARRFCETISRLAADGRLVRAG
jgi:hypothetical protein